jgi:hypothetical protein
MLAFVVREGLAGAVTGRRSWLLGLGLVIPALFALIADRIRRPATNAKPVEQQADLASHERSTA